MEQRVFAKQIKSTTLHFVIMTLGSVLKPINAPLACNNPHDSIQNAFQRTLRSLPWALNRSQIRLLAAGLNLQIHLFVAMVLWTDSSARPIARSDHDREPSRGQLRLTMSRAWFFESVWSRKYPKVSLDIEYWTCQTLISKTNLLERSFWAGWQVQYDIVRLSLG